jgi:hypothetical protein
MKIKPPPWLPYLGPPLAGLGAGLIGGMWLQAGFWPSLAIALVFGFAPIIGYRIWKRLHHR